ncbi:leader peptidase (prepilin peptidase) / N-methyltransferase [Lachnospiraceae bacterium C7]|nr:leader peptidase (prepilin peptidase) / N-methyltransferase [Lachnospiraceae bacterium C7]
MSNLSTLSTLAEMTTMTGMTKYLVIPIILWITSSVYLALMAYSDVKTKEIPVKISIGFGIAGIALTLFSSMIFSYGSVSYFFKSFSSYIIFALIPGAIVFAVAYFTGQAVGYGDAIVITVLGILMGGKGVFSLVLYAIFIAGFMALVEIFILKKDKKFEMPFVPFLFVAYVMANAAGFLF